MDTIDARVADFLAQRRIVVSGVSASRETPANLIYRKLRGAGYDVFALSPNHTRFDDDVCFPDLASIPADPDGVVIVNRPEVTLQVVRQCIDRDVPRVWMHGSLGTKPRLFKKVAAATTSVSDEAVALCRAHGVTVIPGACPMMFCEPVDAGHKCMRWIHRRTGSLAV